MKDGYIRLAAVTPQVTIANVDANVKAVTELWNRVESLGAEIALTPEMSLTGYTCADLFHNRRLLDSARAGLESLIIESHNHAAAVIVGLPLLADDGALYNCAAFIHRGSVALVAKANVPNYNEFYERRWWQPLPVGRAATVTVAGERRLITSGRVIDFGGVTLGIEICEDLWVPVPPSCQMALDGAKIIFNLSASDDLVGKYDYLRSLVTGQSARLLCAYVYASAGCGESSTDLVFSPKAMIAENGVMLAEKPRWDDTSDYILADVDLQAIERDRMHLNTFNSDARFTRPEPIVIANQEGGHSGRTSPPWPQEKLLRPVNPYPFVPKGDAAIDERASEIINIQSAGVQQRLRAIGCRNIVVGISGGLDSTLALLVAVHAFDALGLPRTGIHGITMPGFGTTGRTHDNAVQLMRLLGVSMREISIVPAVNQHFKDIGHDPEVHNVTYENSQARQRTLLLMDIANQVGGIVLGTGDLSELALGWATYNGDHISMYGVNAGVPKTLVRYLVRWFTVRPEYAGVRDVLLDIIDTPISPELIPANADGTIAQRTEDLVGPYELHDFFLYYMLRYGFAPERVYRLACQAFEGTQHTHEVIRHWQEVFTHRFFAQQFKRSCLPDGPKVGSVCLSPRGDWRLPSDCPSAPFRK